MPIVNRPVFTETCDAIESFTPRRGSLYVAGRSVEARSGHVDAWRARAQGVDFAEISDEDRSSIGLRNPDGTHRTIALRSDEQILAFWNDLAGPLTYLDITGLRHHVWAALLRGALATRQRIVVVYVEPRDYRPSLTPTENEIYDLSERIEGVSPLPGFARLREAGDQSCFVPLLGFEGTRVAYLVAQLEPPGGKIIPVVGVPGFLPEYPFATYLGNRTPLLQTESWKKVRYATANCPFDAFYTLQEIHAEYPDHLLKVAPIGTKPHALGGVLYAIANPTSVELVYDHPIRKAQRTEGTARLLLYHVSSLIG